MLYIFDKFGNKLGHVKIGQVSICYNKNGHIIGRIGKTGNYYYLYSPSGNLLAMFNGISTYNSYSNLIGKGNLLYSMLYSNMSYIKY